MALWLDVDDVRRRALGADEDFDDAQLSDLIEDAEDVAEQAFPDLADRVTSGVTKLRTVQRVLAGAVIRRIRNPDGIRTIQDSTGPFAGSTTFAGDHPGEIYLTDDDRSALAPPAVSEGRVAFSVRPNLGRR